MQTIFVVDDEQIIASTLSAILRHSGYTVETFTNSLEVKQAALRFRPALLIADMQMRKLDGLHLAMAIRKEVPNIKVLLVSGMYYPEIMSACTQELGRGYEFMLKPVGPSAMLKKVAEMLKAS